MARSSILGGERPPVQPSGRGADRLGPSDSSDSGSDSIGELGPEQLASDSDRFGTGERSSVDPDAPAGGEDIVPDHLDRASAGGGDGSDLDVDELAASEDEGDSEADADGDRA